MIPGGGEAAKAGRSGTFSIKAREENKLALVTYPERFKSWDYGSMARGFSLHTSAKQMSWLTALGDLIWSYPSYPELTLAKNFQRADANLAKFDEIAAQRKVSLFAGTDAHSNIGFHLFGDDAGNKPIRIKLDPYETIFRVMRIHVLLPTEVGLTRETLIEAIRNGHCFVAFDALGDATNFTFRELLTGQIMGSDAPIAPVVHSVVIPRPLRLEAVAPLPARFVLYKDGEKVSESSRTVSLVAEVENRGSFRVEVYRDDLGPPFDKIPWILSNTIV